jgi:RimJ/RimL family protein N-acetyltransferase
VIETERLVLRPPEDGDVEAVYRFVADPEVMRWIGDNGRTGTYADAAERIERYRRA